MGRMTKQKKLLNEQASKFKSFFDANELYDSVSKKDKKIGIATVYRFLNYLEKDRKVHSFMCDNKKIYSNNKTSHAHFRCEKCDKITHIEVKNLDFLKDSVDGDVCCFQIELSGICPECK